MALSSAIVAKVVDPVFQENINLLGADRIGALAPLHTEVQVPTGRSILATMEGEVGIIRSRVRNPKLILFPLLMKQCKFAGNIC